MTRRYFVPHLPLRGGHISLPDSEALHAIKVIRVRDGQEVELFDGRGHQARARISQVGRNHCECEVEPGLEISREPEVTIDLGIALPKPERAKELIERLTELGVRSLTPIVADRSQRPPSDALLDKLSRVVIEACKQSGRNQLLQIHPTQTAKHFFAHAGSETKLIAHPSQPSLPLRAIQRDLSVTAAIGPEGGWTEEEVTHAVDEGFKTIVLGSRVYRIETAAVAITAVLVDPSTKWQSDVPNNGSA